MGGFNRGMRGKTGFHDVLDIQTRIRAKDGWDTAYIFAAA